jgi:hypothetical protein
MMNIMASGFFGRRYPGGGNVSREDNGVASLASEGSCQGDMARSSCRMHWLWNIPERDGSLAGNGFSHRIECRFVRGRDVWEVVISFRLRFNVM